MVSNYGYTGTIRPEDDRRVVIERVRPEIDGRRFPIKRVVGERVVVEADIFADGHDSLSALLCHRKMGDNGRFIVYFKTMSRADILPSDRDQLQNPLDIYVLEKAVYEVGCKLNNRPDWVLVPLQGILQLMEDAE